MRLSTDPGRDDARALDVIHAALDAGATLLDTADAYCRDEQDVGHNERLVATALKSWRGDPRGITLATKGGLRRPKGEWVNDGRAKHLREACEASRRALGVDQIALYQLHAPDPKTPLETSVRALAALQREGAIRQIGLCNVTVSQIERARQICEIASVQVSLSVLDDENLRNGVAEYCREHGIRLMAFRPLGGERVHRLQRDPVLSRIATESGTTAEAVALGWLMSFDAEVVPIPGATRVETARAVGSALAVQLTENDCRELDARFSGRLLRVPRAERQPPPGAKGDIVLVMGMPGAGKTTIATELEGRGYGRLNRDALGGSLSDLVPRLDALLAAGGRQVILDNTYPTRKSRSDVVECAWARGVPVRCIWLDTGIGDAQINAIERMVEAHGGLPTPEEIRERGKSDPRYLLPDAQFRYERTLEAPTSDEGFAAIERRAFARATRPATARALLLDFDDIVVDDTLIDGRRETLSRHHADGWKLFAHAWRPAIARGALSASSVDASLETVRERLGLEIALAYCPHDAGPPVCWCRKPIPGSVVEFARRRGIALDRSMVVGRSAADRTLAERLGAGFVESEAFWASQHPI